MRLRELVRRMKWDTQEIDETHAELLDACALAAYTARISGVRPSLIDLVDPIERAAWQAAGERYDIEMAARIGTASQGPEGSALVLSEIDGGDSAIQVGVRQTARAFAEAFRVALGG